MEVKKRGKTGFSESSYIYQSADTIHFGYETYKVNSLVNDVLTITFLKKDKISGAEFNTYAPPIEENELIANKPFSLTNLKGKYVLIDFWGSWCGPCIKSLPELKRTYETYKSKVQFLSVAFDKPANIPKLKEIAEANGMTWHHVFDNMEEGKSKIAKQYRVQEFPTSVLIDPNGKVVYRSKGENGLIELAKHIKALNLN